MAPDIYNKLIFYYNTGCSAKNCYNVNYNYFTDFNNPMINRNPSLPPISPPLAPLPHNNNPYGPHEVPFSSNNNPFGLPYPIDKI